MQLRRLLVVVCIQVFNRAREPNLCPLLITILYNSLWFLNNCTMKNCYYIFPFLLCFYLAHVYNIMAGRIQCIGEMLLMITLFLNMKKSSTLMNVFLCCQKIVHGHSCYVMFALCVGPGCKASLHNMSHALNQDARHIGHIVWLTCEPTR